MKNNPQQADEWVNQEPWISIRGILMDYTDGQLTFTDALKESKRHIDSFLQSLADEVGAMVAEYALPLCIPMKLKDDGVHITFKCPDCKQMWGEEEKTPPCQQSADYEICKALSSVQKLILNRIKK